MGIFDDLSGNEEADFAGRTPPTQKFLDWLHGKVDTRNPGSVHHAIGFGPTEASPGNHTHNGKDSKGLWALADVPTDLPGSPTNAQIGIALNQILALLRKVGE